jgi:hypothetical protein
MLVRNKAIVKEVRMAVKVPQAWYDISVPLKQGMNCLPTSPAPGHSPGAEIELQAGTGKISL